MCFPAGEFIVGNVDLLLGEIEGCPFYIDYRLYEAWNKADLILDVAPGEPEEFSLGPGGGMHFVVRSEACALPDKLPLQRGPITLFVAAGRGIERT
jgi:uncharacterized protein (DUF779 family)